MQFPPLVFFYRGDLIAALMKSSWTISGFVGLNVLFLAASIRGDDFPQWRGPKRDGISQEKGLLKEWPKDGPKLMWQVKDLGSGYSTPSIVGDRLYVISNNGTG